MKGLDDAVTSLSLHSVTRSRRRPPSSTDSSTVMLSQSSVLNDSNASRQEQRLLGLSIPVEQYEGIKVAIAQHLQYAPNKAFNGVKLVFEFGTQVHFNVQTLNKLQKFVHTRSELSRFGCLARFSYDGKTGILTVGMPSKEHDRTAGETEKIIRSQLWHGGFYWGNWGQTEEGIKCRQSEGIDRQSRSRTVTREAPDGSLWIDELSPKKPMLVIEVAVSEPYDHVRDKCEIWLTQHEGFIKFAVAINIEKWKHKEEKQAAALKEEQVALMLAAGNRKRKPSDEAGPSDPGKRPKSGDAVPRVQKVYNDDDDDELTDIEDLEVFTPDSPEDPTPITHKFRRATVSVFRSARVNRHRVMQTVINQMPVWPEPPSEMWKLSWNDMDVSMPDSHKDKIFEVTFEALHEFLAKELLRDPPPVEGSWGWHPDSQVSTSSSGLSSVPDQV